MASRLTAAQIISAGKYLEPDFDPNTLTINQLLGVFGYHNISFPMPYTKPKLLAVFNEQIKANSAHFKTDKLKKDNSIASDDGITDGVTGKPLSQKPVARRTSRRLSRAPTAEPQEEEDEPARPEPPKRRRSSAQPSLGSSSSRKKTSTQPTLAEESEPEEIPVRRVKSKKTSGVGAAKEPRLSDQFPEDSGWEDNNVFQSGAEDSSPARPSPAKLARQTRRLSPSRSRRSTKSSSAPPQLPPSPERLAPSTPQRIPPQSGFHVELSPQIQPRTPAFARANNQQPSPHVHRPPVAVPSIVYEVDEPLSAAVSQTIEPQREPSLVSEQIIVDEDAAAEEAREIDDEEEDGPEEDDSQDAEAEHAGAVAKRIAEGGKEVALRRPSPGQSTGFSFLRALAILVTVCASFVVYDRKVESATLGFCDTGTRTNAAVEARIIYTQAVEECNRLNSSLVYIPPAPTSSAIDLPNADQLVPKANEQQCPPLPLLPLPPPMDCTPCPRHAKCTQDTVTCETGYLLRPHGLLAFLPPPPSDRRVLTSGSPDPSPSETVWRVISAITDGLPGLGAVAFPPRCVEDPRWKWNIGALGKAIDALLGQEKGRRVCSGQYDALRVDANAGGEARKWGMELGALKSAMKRGTAPYLLDTFEDTFQEAIQKLTQRGGVITGEDTEGRKYIARDVPDMGWNCVLTVKARETWQQWRSNVFTAVFLLIAVMYGKRRRATRRLEEKRAAELVQIALDALRNQELVHYTDPVSAPAPYLSSLQLRDLVLQDEHSVSTRARLWDRVERVVEANANVRANLEEVPGGDEMRVWRWIGGAGSHKRLVTADED